MPNAIHLERGKRKVEEEEHRGGWREAMSTSLILDQWIIPWKQLIMWSCERNCWRSCWGGMFLNLIPNRCFVEQLTCLIQILLLIFALRHSRAYELCSDCSHHSIFMGAGGVIWHFLTSKKWFTFLIPLRSSIKFFLGLVGFNTQLFAEWIGWINL